MLMSRLKFEVQSIPTPPGFSPTQIIQLNNLPSVVIKSRLRPRQVITIVLTPAFVQRHCTRVPARSIDHLPQRGRRNQTKPCEHPSDAQFPTPPRNHQHSISQTSGSRAI